MSEEINISNYESYAMDYIDGTLNAEFKASFDAFLMLNPAVAEELKALSDVEKLAPSAPSSFDKNDLKIQFSGAIDAESYEDYMIGSIEGTLNLQEEKDLRSFIALNPLIERDIALYQKTILRPDNAVVFPLKSSSKKPLPLWQNTSQVLYRVAAVAVVLFGSLTIWNTINEENYVPRTGMQDYTLIEALMEQPTAQQEVKATPENPSPSFDQMAATNPTVQQRSSIKHISKLEADIKFDNAHIVERGSLSYQPKVGEWIEEKEFYAEVSAPQELNLNQFIGKQFLGLDPEKTPTTLALMKEGLVKTIDNQENLTLETSEETSDKKTIEFLAGNFGFKRVSYK